MSDQNESFEKDLEQLIMLFKKIRHNIQNEQFTHLDKGYAQNLDFIINNYEMVKNQIPREIFLQMGIPFQKMFREFIAQLKAELGEEMFDLENSTNPASGEKMELANDIEKIDLMLKNPGLSEEELNHLLDQRNEIIRNRKNGLTDGL